MAISLKRKEAIRQQHPLYGQQRIMVAHVVDKFLGGSDDDDNLVPMTYPEHIADHYVKAINSDRWSIAEKHYGGAHLIALKATEAEIEEANRLLAQMPKVRRK